MILFYFVITLKYTLPHFNLENLELGFAQTSLYIGKWKDTEQECIPIGCVPSAAVAVCWWGGGGSVSAQGVGVCIPASTKADTLPNFVPPPLWTEFLTYACENITLPQADGKELLV